MPGNVKNKLIIFTLINIVDNSKPILFYGSFLKKINIYYNFKLTILTKV